MADSLSIGQIRVNTIGALEEIYGEPLYEGNSDALLSEAVIINILNETRPMFNGRVSMDETFLYNDVTQVTSFDDEYVLYLTSFKCGDLVYTFYSEDRNGRFAFYSIRGIAEEG
jgi:hypothetical protein